MKKILTILFLFILINSVGAQTLDTDTIRRENPDIEFLEKLIFEEINNYRISKGLNVIEWNDELANKCKRHCTWMNRIKKSTHSYGHIGECIFEGGHAFGRRTYRFHAILYAKQWIESPPHSAILLSEYRYSGGVGIKVEDNSYNGIFITFQTGLRELTIK